MEEIVATGKFIASSAQVGAAAKKVADKPMESGCFKRVPKFEVITKGLASRTAAKLCGPETVVFVENIHIAKERSYWTKMPLGILTLH